MKTACQKLRDSSINSRVYVARSMPSHAISFHTIFSHHNRVTWVLSSAARHERAPSLASTSHSRPRHMDADHDTCTCGARDAPRGLSGGKPLPERLRPASTGFTLPRPSRRNRPSPRSCSAGPVTRSRARAPCPRASSSGRACARRRRRPPGVPGRGGASVPS